MVAHVLSSGDERLHDAGSRVLVIDTDLVTVAEVMAAVEHQASVVTFAGIDDILDELECRPDGVVVISSTPAPAESLARVRARRAHVPVVVVNESQSSSSSLRALGAFAVLGSDAPRAELHDALTGALAFASRL